VESFIRLVTQMNVMSDLDMHWLAAGAIKFIDLNPHVPDVGGSQMLPEFQLLRYLGLCRPRIQYRAANLLLQQTTSALAFIAVLTIVGYFFLKTREIAA
jgi:hypothetical protein